MLEIQSTYGAKLKLSESLKHLQISKLSMFIMTDGQDTMMNIFLKQAIDWHH